MQPSDFTIKPMSSVFQKSEAETVAQNIMIILERTGNEWRELSWEEYSEERGKDGEFTLSEKRYFEQVQPYTISPETARLLSPKWAAQFEPKIRVI